MAAKEEEENKSMVTERMKESVRCVHVHFMYENGNAIFKINGYVGVGCGVSAFKVKVNDRRFALWLCCYCWWWCCCCFLNRCCCNATQI